MCLLMLLQRLACAGVPGEERRFPGSGEGAQRVGRAQMCEGAQTYERAHGRGWEKSLSQTEPSEVRATPAHGFAMLERFEPPGPPTTRST